MHAGIKDLVQISRLALYKFVSNDDRARNVCDISAKTQGHPAAFWSHHRLLKAPYTHLRLLYRQPRAIYPKLTHSTTKIKVFTFYLLAVCRILWYFCGDGAQPSPFFLDPLVLVIPAGFFFFHFLRTGGGRLSTFSRGITSRSMIYFPGRLPGFFSGGGPGALPPMQKHCGTYTQAAGRTSPRCRRRSGPRFWHHKRCTT